MLGEFIKKTDEHVRNFYFAYTTKRALRTFHSYLTTQWLATARGSEYNF
jgi:hypothetical protein